MNTNEPMQASAPPSRVRERERVSEGVSLRLLARIHNYRVAFHNILGTSECRNTTMTHDQKREAVALEALHNISLGSQNSMTSKESLGAEARTAIAALAALPREWDARNIQRNPRTDGEAK
jgi:hypothetical protein